MRARRRTGARSTCRWRSRVLQGRERQFADQERSEGKHHPAPRFFPSLLSRTLFSFLHCFASMRVKAPSWLTKADAGLPQLTPVDRNRECADRTQTRAMIPGLRCATPRGVAQGAVRPEQPRGFFRGARMCRNVPSQARTRNVQNEPNSAKSLVSNYRSKDYAPLSRPKRFIHSQPAPMPMKGLSDSLETP